LPGCLQSLRLQTRRPDNIFVIDNASTDDTAAVAALVSGVHVVHEAQKGLVCARARGFAESTSDVLAYLDADCRAPEHWLSRIERRFARDDGTLAAVTGPYRFYDWHPLGKLIVGSYDIFVAPPAQILVHNLLRMGAILYGGNFAARRDAIDSIGGFDTSIEFHGEDTNLGRRLAAVGKVELRRDCWLYTSARRYRAMGTGRVLSLYYRNFVSEILHHRPADTAHVDVRD
jgi:glycosyltransferase involved in cell wall biosynthesis